MQKVLSKNTFFFSTIFLILTGFIIKVLGLLNKIIITRYLGTEGMSLYIMAFPTILLLINIASLNMNNSISKLISEASINHKYSPKKIIHESFKIVSISVILTILIFLLFLKPLVSNLLLNVNLFWPLLVTVFLIPLVGISDILKGYYNGIKQLTTSSIALVIEQIARISFSITSLIILVPKGIIIATTFTLLALSIGEIGSIIYLLIKLRKNPLTDYPTCGLERKALLKLAIPSTLSRLIGSITYFLEPIIYTSTLVWLRYDQEFIRLNYTIINAYTIPLLSTASFLSFGISTTIIPNISEKHAEGKTQSIQYIIQKVMVFSLIPSLLISIILFFYPNEYMKLIYNTTEGVSFVKPYIFLFVFYYLQMPFMSILHALGRAKLQLIISSFFCFFRIFLIFFLSTIPFINVNSIFYAILISMILNTIVLGLFVFKVTKYKLSLTNSINLLLITIISFFFLSFLKVFIPNFIFNSCLTALLFSGLCKLWGLIEIKSIKNIIKKKSTN